MLEVGLDFEDSVPSFSWGSLIPFKGSIKFDVRTVEHLNSVELATLLPFIRELDDFLCLLFSSGDPDWILALSAREFVPVDDFNGREYALPSEDDRARESPFSRFILSFIVAQTGPDCARDIRGLLGFGCVPRYPEW